MQLRSIILYWPEKYTVLKGYDQIFSSSLNHQVFTIIFFSISDVFYDIIQPIDLNFFTPILENLVLKESNIKISKVFCVWSLNFT